MTGGTSWKTKTKKHNSGISVAMETAGSLKLDNILAAIQEENIKLFLRVV